MKSYDNASSNSSWMRNVSDKVAKEIKTSILCSMLFSPESRNFNEVMEKGYSESGHKYKVVQI